MHVVGGIWCDEIIAGDGSVLQVRCQFRIGSDMAAPARDVGGDIIEKDERIMPCDVRIVIQERVVGVVIIFLITLPGNARVFEQRDQMAIKGARGADEVGLERRQHGTLPKRELWIRWDGEVEVQLRRGRPGSQGQWA